MGATTQPSSAGGEDPGDDRPDGPDQADDGADSVTGGDEDADQGGADERKVDQDDLFDILSNRRRRYALHALTGTGEETELGALAEQVAAWENGTTVPDVTPAQRKRVYTALQQSHLPRMDEMGVVEFDKQAGTITPTEEIDEFDVYMNVVEGPDIPWSEYYLALAALSAAAVAGAWVGIPVVSSIPPLGLAAVVVTGFALSAAAHVHYTRNIKVGGGESPPDVET
jgi:hypothetical protein